MTGVRRIGWGVPPALFIATFVRARLQSRRRVVFEMRDEAVADRHPYPSLVIPLMNPARSVRTSTASALT